MSDTKQCFGCGAPIIRQYFTMIDEKNKKEVTLCPKCKKLWKKYSPNAKNVGDTEVDIRGDK